MAIAAENPLGLRIPAQAEPKGELLNRPREVEDWVKRLPVGSATEMAKKIFRAIQDINRAPIDPATRIQIAERLTPSIEYSISALGRKFLDTSFPLTEKAHRAAYICVRLYEELAFSYKLAVHEVARGKIGHQERKILIVALFRSVRHLSDVIYQSTLVYDPFPRYAWRELHNLFAFAETNRWASTRVKLKTELGTRVTSLRELYLQSLMFAAAAPHRLRQRQIRILNDKLPEWVESVHISAAAEAIAKDTCFIVQLKKDQPSNHASLVPKPISKPALELDTTKLIGLLQRMRDDMPADSGGIQTGIQQTDVGIELLDRLINAWGTIQKRRFVRTRLNFDLEIVVGLNRIHRRINGENEIDPDTSNFDDLDDEFDVTGLNEESTFSSELLDAESGLALVPIEDSGHIHLQGYDSVGVITQKEQGPTPEIWQAGAFLDSGQSCTSTLRTLNESAGGYCVNWQGPDIPGIIVGELVGVQSPNDPSNHGLTIVRWMRNDPEQGLQLGLELIASNAYAVLVFETERRRRTPINCLLIPGLKSTDQPTSLITPLLPFKMGDSLQIKYTDSERSVKLTRLLESTGAFAQFQFEYE